MSRAWTKLIDTQTKDVTSTDLMKLSQLMYIERIKSDIMDYNYLIEIIENNEESDFSKSVKTNYDNLLKLFTDKIKS